MAGSLSAAGVNLQPSGERVALASNYLTSSDFNFLNQYLPDTYEAEFERYGNRTVAAFLRMVGAEMPTNSDLIKWSEHSRLHPKYVSCTTPANAGDAVATFTIADTGVTDGAIRVGQTVMISSNTAGSTASNKAIVTGVSALSPSSANTVSVAYYESGGQAMAAAEVCTIFVYGSEFAKGQTGMVGTVEAEPQIFDNSPIILKDKYSVNGSDLAQVGWIEVSTENGASGYLWYLKSEHETRLRFEDYMETAMIEAVPMENSTNAALAKGTKGIFHEVESRGNEWNGGNPTTLSDFDTIIQRLDKQGSIEENVLFINRQFSFDIDDMLAAQNSYGAGGTSYGLFDNDEQMALNLGFSGFRRGYDFYKTDWKYLNDASMRGGITAGKVNGLLVPAGSTTVYDQILGKNAVRPFLHVRYRASEAEDRRYKTWITGSAGAAGMSSDLDAMEVHFLSERAVCVMGANNFFIFKG